jgi:SNF2 family DNA or RNA helicase
MIAQDTTKGDILQKFYEYLDDSDWKDGIDLYQGNRVSGVSSSQGLILGKVAGELGAAANVRVKIHPTARCIQWIECTCQKNRRSGRFCEHIAAFMIHLDRERSDLFDELDSQMPFKPGMGQKRTKEPDSRSNEGAYRSATPTESLLSHLNSGIKAITLVAKGPAMRVRLEIKAGHLTHYDLDLDQAGQFLSRQRHPELETSELRHLNIFDDAVEVGCRFSLEDDEKLTVEKVIAIRLRRNTRVFKQIEGLGNIELAQYSRVGRYGQTEKEHLFAFLPFKKYAKFLGKQYFFLREIGYWPVDMTTVDSGWRDLPLLKCYRQDDTVDIINSGFSEYLAHSAIWLDHNLRNAKILESPQLKEIRLVGRQGDWFHLDPQYSAGSNTISMFNMLMEFRKKKRKYVKNGDNWIRVPEFLTEYNWEVDEAQGQMRVDTLGLMRLKANVGEFDRFVGSKALLEKIRERVEFVAVGRAPDLTGTALKLRSYQTVGLEWLLWLHENHLHGLLADEMGLGKTHQTMALFVAIQNKKPDARFLVIAPTTVLDHWDDKIRQFAPDLQPIKYHGPNRAPLLQDFKRRAGTILTSYGVLLRDVKDLSEIPWDVVVLDEAHFVKNNGTATYHAACRIPKGMRLCLTGTPLENHLGELKNLFDFLLPGYLGSDKYFRKMFQQPAESNAAPERDLALQKLIHPFKMRRTKNQVLRDLPEKIIDFRHCNLSSDQIRLYQDVIARKVSPLVKQLEDNAHGVPYLHVFAVLTLLKQICNHPALVIGGSYKNSISGKFELFRELLDESLGSGHKIVVFSQYVEMIKIIENYLTDIEVKYAVLTGKTRNRGAVINRFQSDPDCKVFCGSLTAGGIGIDLTSASVVIHFDRWWNASKENQATDRVHRIGQNKNVQVLKLITRGTIEEKIDHLINSKQEMFDKFVDRDEDLFRGLSREQLIDLLT